MAAPAIERPASASFYRPSIGYAAAHSMADTLPSVNFDFDNLREHMALFTARFDDFIETGRRRVLEDRNKFRVNVAEIHEEQRSRKRDVEAVTLKTAMYAQSLSKETQETTEMHAAIQVLAAQRDERAANRETLMSIIQEVQNSIASRKDVQNKHKRYLDGHARFNVSELEFWQNHLCMQILGTEDGHKLKFVFSHIDERDWSREGWFELDMSKSICQVVGCSSTLGESELGRVLDTLDSTQDWSTFLKSMRLLLRNAIS